MWTTMLVLAAGLAGATDDTGLTLKLVPTKSRIMIGEPLKVRVVWSATRPVAVSLDSVKLMVDDGTGFKQHVETQTQTRSVIQAPANLAPGESRVTSHILSVAGGGLPPSARTTFQFAFPRAGRYRVVADYFGNMSNVVAIDVRAPEGKDAELYTKYLRARPELLTEWALMNLRSESDAELAAKLLDEYQGSPYLPRLQLLFWGQQIGEALSTNQELHGRGADLLQGEPGRVLQRIESEVSEGPFDEDRLALVARKKLEWGDRKDGVRLLREILMKHPRGQAAQEARALLAEIEPPPLPEK
jgi:hypothetical protein